MSLATAILLSLAATAAAQRPPETELSTKLRGLCKTTPLAVAHRGASLDYPENTLLAFRAAIAAGAPMVELDFRQTADGELIVMHDETLDRTTNCRALWEREHVLVESVTLSEVRELDAGSWKLSKFAGTPVPTLEESLAVIQKGSITMIEHKAGDPEKLVALLRRLDLVDDVLVQSFDWAWLEKVHELAPRLTIAALSDRVIGNPVLAGLRRTGAAIAHWQGDRLRHEDVAELRRRGYLVCAYTLNSDIELLGAAAIGLDLVTSDRPGRILALQSEGLLERR